MKKRVTKAIEELAAKIPVDHDIKPCDYFFTGEELNLGGYKGKDPNQIYSITWYQSEQINHEDRIKELAKRKGIQGVKEYIQQITKQ